MYMEDIEILAVTGSSGTGYQSPIENNPELLMILGIMTARFNILETNISTLISIKLNLQNGESHDYISEEMTFSQKIKLVANHISKDLKQRLFAINQKRNKVIHGKFYMNGASHQISIRHKKGIIEDVFDFIRNINTEIESLAIEVHNVTIYPMRLGAAG